MNDTPTLLQRLLPLVLFGWVVGGIRYAMEFLVPEWTMYFGLYYCMPVALAWVGLGRRWGAVRWTQVAGTMVVLVLLTWFVWNTIAYMTAQFMGWEHGRFAAPIEETTGDKVMAGLSASAITIVGGTVWCLLFGTLVIWLPVRLGRGSE